MSKQQRGSKADPVQDGSSTTIHLPDIPLLNDSELKFDSPDAYETVFNKYNGLFLQYCEAVNQCNSRRFVVIDILDKIQRAYDDQTAFGNDKSDDDSDEKLMEVSKQPSSKISVKNVDDEPVKKKKLGEPKVDREAKKKEVKEVKEVKEANEAKEVKEVKEVKEPTGSKKKAKEVVEAVEVKADPVKKSKKKPVVVEPEPDSESEPEPESKKKTKNKKK